MDTNTTTYSTATTSSTASPRTGVADYFALLGVGEELTWKHTVGPAETPEVLEAQEEERFMREIVSVRIDCVYGNDPSSETDHPEETSTTTTATTSGGPVEPLLNTVASYQTDTTRSSQEVPGVGSDDDLHLHKHHQDDVPNSDAEGWIRQKQTRPLMGGKKSSVWTADLGWETGLRRQVLTAAQSAPAGATNQRSYTSKSASWRRKMTSIMPAWSAPSANAPTTTSSVHSTTKSLMPQFFLSYRRRHNRVDRGIAQMKLSYVRLHVCTLPHSLLEAAHAASSSTTTSSSSSLSWASHLRQGYQSQAAAASRHNDSNKPEKAKLVSLVDWLPEEQEWIVPEAFTSLVDWRLPPPAGAAMTPKRRRRLRQTAVVVKETDLTLSSTVVESIETTITDEGDDLTDQDVKPGALAPKWLESPPKVLDDEEDEDYVYVPILSVRRQRIGDEERYHEDPAIVDVTVSFCNAEGLPVDPADDDDEDEDDADAFTVLGKSAWIKSADPTSPTPTAGVAGQEAVATKHQQGDVLGAPVLLVKRNLPFGFADAAFSTSVLDRFPMRNYKGLPLPEEELPMFSYPTGLRLHRAKFCDAPLAEYYGFVVKNERGDSIYVSCVSFMEPLTKDKVKQLDCMSERRRDVSLPHRRFCEEQERQRSSMDDAGPWENGNSSSLLTGFEEMTTFENKTICLVSRYPFWTAFRKFLSNLHIMSGSSSELPLERYISHLLLSVPRPRPGGPSILVPLPALNEPLVLQMPPEKDFGLLDLPYQRLFACLDIRKVVVMVLGLLALERKVIVLSTRPSLVLDVCELLRSLLFPFELCAPYVPRLTEPFKSSLEFPGAIFVGIHDDGSPHGLAASVRKTLPEDSILVDLDNGDMECDGDRAELFARTWEMIPDSARTILVSELETLCRDAGIVDGQEPLDSQYDSAFSISLPSAVDDCHAVGQHVSREPLDDRAVRDAFLRFFCAVMGGYERYLVVPDADFLVSGNEWFDSAGFLGSVPQERRAYLNALVSTQLFQSFIQRRTEASDVHCLLFDECMAEYHSAPIPYGRLGGDVETNRGEGDDLGLLYSLLVDQSAALPYSGSDHPSISLNRSMDASEADSSLKNSVVLSDVSTRYSDAVLNIAGDVVTTPSRQDLPKGRRFVYCVDGNPCFPHHFNSSLFLPQEPESLLVEMSKSPNPLLARSEKEREAANRRRRMATSHRGLRNQHRCHWQLPKLMGSHFLGTWLLCLPAQVSQPHLSSDQQSRYLLRALGALRLLRSKQRIVPDEAAYRATMVACGRTRSDRRVELVKLFGLLRSDGIFPSAVTLGQYTRALAEGYSKQKSGHAHDEEHGVEGSEAGSRVRRLSITSTSDRGSVDFDASLSSLDSNLATLESHGKRWRQRHPSEHNSHGGDRHEAESKPKRRTDRPWLPVVLSSSFVATNSDSALSSEAIRFVAIWSRTRSCSSCAYVPLEEEVQAGWDVVGGENEIPGAIACPRCGSLIVPMLGYEEMTAEEALQRSNENRDMSYLPGSIADFGDLPPQIGPNVESPAEDGVAYVTYVSPATLRLSLEQYVEEHGEEVLERDRLRQLDPEVFYNFWWYCARFSLPLSLPTSHDALHLCAFAAWDRRAAERGCYSAAKVVRLMLRPLGCSSDLTDEVAEDQAALDAFEDSPLLSRFNLQGFYSSVWDHPDLSKILVSLVEACDRRDFRPVLETVLQSNQRRREKYGLVMTDTGSDVNGAVEVRASSDGVAGLAPSVELDFYLTVLYLAKYQCTTAFHAFFPATVKACKGYHFWCALGTPLPMFDRLLREAAQRLGKDNRVAVPIRDVNEVALGFRCVFGHLV